MSTPEQLLTERYGEPVAVPPSGDATWLSVVNHRSCRVYRPDPLPDGMLEQLVAAAQSAATSSHLQSWSVVALEAAERKSAAAALSGGQDFIWQAPLFLVFCADLSRLVFASEQHGLPGEGLDYLEMFLMAVVDATLAAQNLVVAAEAAGLGTCYVGGARNNPLEMAALLGLPERCLALFGLSVGWPDAPHAMRPRLPQCEVLHHDRYSTAGRVEHLARYDEIMHAVYLIQGRDHLPNWTHHAAARIATAQSLGTRHTLRESAQQLGFPIK